jgi:hypothetical protein
MRTLLASALALGAMTTVALAAESTAPATAPTGPVEMTNTQMDKVVAGQIARRAPTLVQPLEGIARRAPTLVQPLEGVARRAPTLVQPLEGIARRAPTLVQPMP